MYNIEIDEVYCVDEIVVEVTPNIFLVCSSYNNYLDKFDNLVQQARNTIVVLDSTGKLIRKSVPYGQGDEGLYLGQPLTFEEFKQL